MQRQSSITSVSPSNKVFNNTTTRKQSPALRTLSILLTIIPGAIVAGTLTTPNIASAAEVTCHPVSISDGYSTTFCSVSRGEVREPSGSHPRTAKTINWILRSHLIVLLFQSLWLLYLIWPQVILELSRKLGKIMQLRLENFTVQGIEEFPLDSVSARHYLWRTKPFQNHNAPLLRGSRLNP